MPRKRQRPEEEEADDDDGHDVHRISSEHLQQLYEEAKKDPLDELLFMLMLTTGLRVGGVTKVLTRNVAEVKNGMLVVGQAGKTKEKGNKFARFVLCEQVRELMHAWLNQHRPADPGPYVFPGIAQGGQSPLRASAAAFTVFANGAVLKVANSTHTPCGTRTRIFC